MSMSGHDPTASTAENYRAFAAEAHGRSPQYEELARAVADDPLVLGFLGTLPAAKRQPNLLFAVARYLLGAPADIAALRKLARDRGDEVAAAMRTRRTQTNEPARCATLLPALALLPQPLALLEVGASAGLTLLPDRYSYDYNGTRLTGTDPAAPVLACDARGPVPLPAVVPEVSWRAGLDLNPLDVTRDADVRWLECLLWPGETGREERLAAAIETARRDPPPVHRGDLLADVPLLAAQAPPGATLVIFHSAVLAYLSMPQRASFAATVAAMNAVWLSNEAPGILPGTLRGIAAGARDAHDFVLVRDGGTPLAVTDGHGTWLDWLD
jgi:hypothetical protein